jgi:Flagellar hook capping protein
METVDFSQSTSQKRELEKKQAGFGASTEDFMKLLVAQLANQDPMNPMEDMDFTGQLAQLQSLQEQIAMTKSMNAMRMDSQFQSATNLIGQEVTGLDENNEPTTGVVVRVVQTAEDVMVELGNGKKVSVSGISNIVGSVENSLASNIASSTAAIGKFVEAGKDVRGIVQSVDVVDGQVQLKLYGGESVTWDEINSVRPIEESDEVYFLPDKIREDYVKAYTMLNKVVHGTNTKGEPTSGIVADAEITPEGKVNLILVSGERIEVNKVTSTPTDPTAQDITDNLAGFYAGGYDKDGVRVTGKIVEAEERDDGIVLKLEDGKEVYWDMLEYLSDEPEKTEKPDETSPTP